MRRRITKAKIKFLSLVPRGANRLPTIFKEDGAFEVALLLKDSMGEKGELTAIVYAPELWDSQEEIASAEVIKDMLYDSAREGVEIDIRHDGKALSREQVYVAEQFLVQKGDPRFEGLKDYSGRPVDPTGAWGVVIKIEDPQLRKLYREGAWEGISMGGNAQFAQEKEDPDDLADRIVKALEKRLNPEEDTMTKEQIQELATTVANAVVKGMADAAPQKPTSPAAPEKKKPAERPVFKGDPTDVEALKAHREELRKHGLQERLNKATSTKEIDEILKELEEKPKGSDDGNDGDSDEVKKLKKQQTELEAKLQKAQGASRQPPPSDGNSNGNGTQPSQLEGVSKEDQDRALIGSNMAKWANAQRS